MHLHEPNEPTSPVGTTNISQNGTKRLSKKIVNRTRDKYKLLRFAPINNNKKSLLLQQFIIVILQLNRVSHSQESVEQQTSNGSKASVAHVVLRDPTFRNSAFMGQRSKIQQDGEGDGRRSLLA